MSRQLSILKKNDVIYARQFGFRKHHSTTNAVMDLVGNVLKAFENDLMLLGVFVDLRKAFDTMSHSIILQKLEAIGIKGVTNQWYQSYLSNRMQFTKPGDVQSNYLRPSLWAYHRARCLEFCFSSY